MLDINVISSEKVPLRKVIFYEYNTAIFKPRVYQKIRNLMLEKGVQIRQLDYDNVIFSFNENSLFGEFIIIVDLDEMKANKKWKDHLSAMADLISSKEAQNRYLFYLRKGTNQYEGIRKLPQLDAIVKSSTVITEPTLTKQNFGKIFDFICKQYEGLFELTKIPNFEMFKTSIEDYVITEKPDLTEFFNKFDLFVFVAIDAVTNEFNPQIFRSLLSTEDKVQFLKTHKLIFDFILSPNRNTAAKVYKDFDNHLNKRSLPIKLIISSLFKITKDFSMVNSKLNPGKHAPEDINPYVWKQLLQFEHLPLKALFKWQVLLSKYESDFNTGNLALKFQQFLEEFYEKD